jgi:predicted phosphohydrolase
MLSDTHGYHRDVDVPDGDLLIHAGDFTMFGEVDAVRDFNTWLGTLPHSHKVVIAGNHDLTFERTPNLVKPLITNATYLENSGVEINGIKIWGSPMTPIFNSDFWVFHTKSPEERQALWATIPQYLDILITHGPPQHNLDLTLEGDFAGDQMLAQAVLYKMPKIHVFGHIHEGYGTRSTPTTKSFNAAILDRVYRIKNKPWVIDYEKTEASLQSAAREGEGTGSDRPAPTDTEAKLPSA